MPDQINDPVLSGVVAGVLFLSAATWFYILATGWKRGILPFEPRRAVPWAAPACLLALLFAVKPFLSSSGGTPPEDAATNQHSPDVVFFLLNAIVAELLIVGSFTFIVLAFSRATASDAGLPKNAEETSRDIFTGIFACAAAIVPVLAVQALLQYLLHNKSSGHELIKLLEETGPAPGALAMAAVMVVVIAPICEETVFRLLLQGWLEAWEYKRVCRSEPAVITSVQDEFQAPEAPIAADESAMASTDVGQRTFPALIEERPSRGIAGMPFGLVPILASSLLFALAHFGYGPEPVPLFFLALVLGYVYQRTHRILPSIITHGLFNAFAIFILWRLQLHAK
jgi:membrane protease YdiL (CAAX protease family)